MPLSGINMNTSLNYVFPSIQYDEIVFSYNQSTYSVISNMDIQLLKAEINAIDIRIRNEIIEKIFELGSLEENWDSYGGVPISDKAIVNAHSFITKVANDNCLTLRRPFVSPEPRGGLLLKWLGHNREFLVWFMPNQGQYVYLEVLAGSRTGGKVNTIDKLFEIFKKWFSGC